MQLSVASAGPEEEWEVKEEVKQWATGGGNEGGRRLMAGKTGTNWGAGTAGRSRLGN